MPASGPRLAAGLLALVLACLTGALGRSVPSPSAASLLPTRPHTAPGEVGSSPGLQGGAASLPARLARLASRGLPTDEELQELQAILGYNFTTRWLLTEALIHPSFGEWNNARLTWIGDAVLQIIVSDLIYQALPTAATTEELHEARKARVRREACAEGARKLRLQRLLVVGKGYEGQEPTEHMLAEGFEAIWGAVHVDRGFQKLHCTRQMYEDLFPLTQLGTGLVPVASGPPA